MLIWLHERKWFFQVLIGFSLAIVFLTGLFSPAESDVGRALPRTGFTAPPIALPDDQNQMITLEDFKGSVIILNFWASWCPPCRAEMPAFQEVYEGYNENGLVIIGVNATYQDDDAAARQFVTERGVKFPILFDKDNSASRLYQIQALPTTFFIDQRGIIRKVIYGGPLNEALLKIEVEKLIGEER